MPVSEDAWQTKKDEMRDWVQRVSEEKMTSLTPAPIRCAFISFVESLVNDPPAESVEALLLGALYDTLRKEEYLHPPPYGRYRVVGRGEDLRVRFTEADVSAYLDERIAWLGERAGEGNHLAGHYADAVGLVRKAIFGEPP